MSSNQVQIEYWNKRAGETWAELQDRLDALLAPLSTAGLAAAHSLPEHTTLRVAEPLPQVLLHSPQDPCLAGSCGSQQQQQTQPGHETRESADIRQRIRTTRPRSGHPRPHKAL